MGNHKLGFKLSHVIARSWFARLRRAYRLKPGLHSFAAVATANTMSCRRRDGGGDDEDSLALLKNHNSKAEAEDMAEFRKCERKERQKKQGKGKGTKKQGKFPLSSYNSWCRREAPKNVEESCHYSIPSKRKGKKEKIEESERGWEREGFWSVIAQVGDAKIVRKKVVLKKKRVMMNREGGALAVGVMEGQRAPANSDNSEEEDRKSAKNSSQVSQSSSSRSSKSSSSSSTTYNFRLSTCSSSGNASLAWEKEHYSPFAASDKSTHDQTVDCSSTCSSCLFDHEEHEELREENKGLCCTKRCESSNLEASVRAWDDKLGVITSALLRRHDVPSRSRSFEESSYNAQNEFKHGGGEDGRAKVVGESVAVTIFSSDPYEDFKQSMVQMIVEKRLFKAVELEELLERYLCLNSPGYHGLIVQVFSDLWLQVF